MLLVCICAWKIWIIHTRIRPTPSCTVEVWKWISNFISQFTGHMSTYPCWDLKLIHVSKRGPRHAILCVYSWLWNWPWGLPPIEHIPQCTSPISHNAPFCNRNPHIGANFCYNVVHCGIFSDALWDLWDGSIAWCESMRVCLKAYSLLFNNSCLHYPVTALLVLCKSRHKHTSISVTYVIGGVFLGKFLYTWYFARFTRFYIVSQTALVTFWGALQNKTKHDKTAWHRLHYK